jgi:S-formylglutathione hydrolase FrmB
MQQTESIREFGGYLNRYTHASETCRCEMTFSVYLPPQAEQQPVPALYWLSGLTCTDDNVRVKAGAQRYAAEHGLALVMPDTSPRGADVPDEPQRYDLGQGTADEFLDEGQLLPETLEAACKAADIPLRLRMQAGYDHSYHFIASFIGEHIAFHARALGL